nr:uncharacterized protein LOC127317953 isoform X4 [Lolium perenne]
MNRMEVVQTMMLSFKFGRNCVVQSLLIINPTSSPSRRHLGRNHCLALLVIAVLPPPPPSSRRAAVDEHASRVAQPAAACCVVAARSGWWPAGAAHFLHLHFMALQCYFLILVLDGRKTSSRRTLIGVRLLGPEIEMNQIWQIRPFMDHNHDILLDGRAYAKPCLCMDIHGRQGVLCVLLQILQGCTDSNCHFALPLRRTSLEIMELLLNS